MPSNWATKSFKYLYILENLSITSFFSTSLPISWALDLIFCIESFNVGFKAIILGVTPLSMAYWTFSPNAGGVIDPSYTILLANIPCSSLSNKDCEKYDLPAPYGPTINTHLCTSGLWIALLKASFVKTAAEFVIDKLYFVLFSKLSA